MAFELLLERRERTVTLRGKHLDGDVAEDVLKTFKEDGEYRMYVTGKGSYEGELQTNIFLIFIFSFYLIFLR